VGQDCSSDNNGKDLAAYRGEACKNAYDRRKQHLTSLNTRNVKYFVL
jgi:hypothetical protein